METILPQILGPGSNTWTQYEDGLEFGILTIRNQPTFDYITLFEHNYEQSKKHAKIVNAMRQ